ncbi:MAG: class I SAM-dependent RNA methyltransferase [Pseudomonadota bacterium]
MKSDQAVTVTISALGQQGDGLAAHKGARLIIPQTLPGEMVRGQPQGDGLEAIELLSTAPDRQDPPCPHAGPCGGCAVQHASDRFVARWKVDLVRAALARHGVEMSFGRMAVSPVRSRRRAVFSAARGADGVVLGFRARRSTDIVPVTACAVLHPAIAAALPGLAQMAGLALGSLPPARQGDARLQVTLSDTGLDLDISGLPPLASGPREAAIALAARLDLARLSWEGDPLLIARPPMLSAGPAQIRLPPRAFLQATREGEAALRRAVQEITQGATRIADLFAGCGTFALPLAARARILAVEKDADAIASLDDAWRRAGGLHRLETLTRDLHRRPLSGSELSGYDAVVIDPPRAGAEAQIRVLARSPVPSIASVSCNPDSFARDARILIEGGYRAGPITLIDQFRWSPHIELVAGFTRPR